MEQSEEAVLGASSTSRVWGGKNIDFSTPMGLISRAECSWLELSYKNLGYRVFVLDQF